MRSREPYAPARRPPPTGSAPARAPLPHASADARTQTGQKPLDHVEDSATTRGWQTSATRACRHAGPRTDGPARIAACTRPTLLLLPEAVAQTRRRSPRAGAGRDLRRSAALGKFVATNHFPR